MSTLLVSKTVTAVWKGGIYYGRPME